MIKATPIPATDDDIAAIHAPFREKRRQDKAAGRAFAAACAAGDLDAFVAAAHTISRDTAGGSSWDRSGEA